MGVADNKTYRDMAPYFKDNFNVKGSDLPSINDEPKINSTIKANPYYSNVEIEGKELVLQPDLSALFKAVGKRHTQGGMDVLLRPNSFIFSDDKSLALGANDHHLFELKTGGNFDAPNNTPAAVLKRNVNVKHYNTLVNNIGDKNKDVLAKKSSAMMLEKYISTLGNIAYIQEDKKGFPTGIPDFSVGTAPVYDPSVKNQVMETKQFAKYGGKIYAGGGEGPCPCGEDKQGNCLPCDPSVYQNLLKTARRVNAPLPGYNQLYDTPEATLFGKFGQKETNPPNKGNPDFNIAFGNARKQGLKNFTWNSKLYSTNIYNPGTKSTPDDYVYMSKTRQQPNPSFTPLPVPPTANSQKDFTLNPNTVTGKSQGPIKFPWQFTPWQKISQAYSWGQFANVQRYMPYRSRYNATYAEPSLVNPEQTVGDVKALTNQQTSSLNTLNPILRNAQASSAYGQMLNTVPGIRTQYDNQNAGITNQFREYNNQVKNNETQANLGFDQQYYKEAIAGRQNFSNMRTYLANQAMNNTLRDVESNQKLAYNLATIDHPAYGYDFRTDTAYRNPIDIRDVTRRDSQDTFNAMLAQVMKMKEAGLDPSIISSLVRGQYFKQAAPYFSGANNPPPFQKKGGTLRNPYK